MSMPRRFTILAAVLVALNVFLWVVPAGMALRQSLVNQLFGPAMIRAEVVVQSGQGSTADYRIDRGVVTAATAAQITLREADGTVQSIPLAPTTRFSGLGRLGLASLLRRPTRVLVVRLANGPAISIDVEGSASSLGFSREARGD